MKSSSPRLIALLVIPSVQLLDVSGPADVFAEANRLAGRTLYELRLVGVRPGPVQASSGTRLLTDADVRQSIPKVDTLLVAGAPMSDMKASSASTLAWLAEHAKRSRRFGSVCTGAFILAAAGLLHGRRVTTHWSCAETLRTQYPDIDVDVDAIHVRDGKVRTAAGVTSGLDLALALVEEDHGPALARGIAANLVMYFRRPGGGQMQFSRNGQAEISGRSSLQELQRWVVAHPGMAHSVSSMAERLGLSERHFARIFRAEAGLNPGAWLDEVRLAEGRRLLEGPNGAPKQAAAACGFSDVNSFSRAFRRAFGVSPAQYRRGHAGTSPTPEK